jgi:hypothetical protein
MICNFLLTDKFWDPGYMPILRAGQRCLFMGSTQLPIQCLSGSKRKGHEDRHSDPSETRLRTRGVVAQLSHTSSWRGAYLSTGTNFRLLVNYDGLTG